MSTVLPHRLAAVWFADIAGFSRLASQNEDQALQLVDIFQHVARQSAERHGGRLVKFIGDAALAEFSSTETAIKAAALLHRTYRERAAKAGLTPPDLHIGVHVGEVATAADGDLYGDGLNIASWLQTTAAPGQTLVSEDVWRQLHHRPGFRFEPLGARLPKGREAPVEVYQIELDPEMHADSVEETSTEPLILPGFRHRAAVLAAVVLAVAGGWVLWRARPAGAPVAADVVAVLPFSVRGDPAVEYLGEGMVNLLGTKLDGLAGVRGVTSPVVLEVASSVDEPLDPIRGALLARQLGAGLYVLGEIVEAGGNVNIRATMYRSEGRHQPVAEASVQGNATDVFGLVDRLAARLLGEWVEQPASQLTSLAAMTTDSLAALKAYLEGEREYAAGRFTTALSAFQQAVEIDPLFALAYHRLAITATWTGDYDLVEEATDRAVRYATRLAPNARLLVEAQLALLNTDVAEVERRIRPYLEDHPEDMDAWFILGDALLHDNEYRGRSMAEADEPFERAFQIDSQNMWPLDHLMWIAASQERYPELDSLLSRVGPGTDFTPHWRALRDFAVGSQADREKAVTTLSRTPSDDWRRSATVLVLYAPAATAASVRRVLDEPPSMRADTHSIAQGLRGLLELRLGRWNAAQAPLEEFTLTDRSRALQMRVLYATTSFFPATRVELSALRDDLADGGASSDSDSEVSLWPVFRPYLLGLVDLRLGDRAAAERAVTELESREGEELAARSGRFLASSLRARLAVARGRHRQALGELPEFPVPVPSGMLFNSPVLSHPHDRFLRAELLRGEGRMEEALGWYQALTEVATPYDLPFAAMSHLRSAQILDGMGRSGEASLAYLRFVELWREADPVLQPLVTEARARVRDLAQERAGD